MSKKKVERQKSNLQNEEVLAHNREVEEIVWCGIKFFCVNNTELIRDLATLILHSNMQIFTPRL